MKRGEFWTAAGVIVALLLGIMYMMDSNETELRTEIQGLRDDVREDLRGMDDNIGGLRTEVTKIAEDVGYLRGRQDERDQGTADQ